MPQAGEEACQLFRLGRRTSIGRTPPGIESAFVANADGAAVEGAAVGPHIEQAAVLRQGTVPTDIEVVAHGAETTGTMVAQELFDGVVLRTTGGRTVKDEVADTVGAAHPLATLHPGEEDALIGHLLTADNQGITVFGHDRKGIKGVQLVMPSAVRAATAACTMALTMEVQVILRGDDMGIMVNG